MDCCGMPMESWPGGGLVCRRCQAKVGVPWGRDRNPFARCVEGAVTEEMAAAALPVQIVPGIDISADTGNVLSADAFAAAAPKMIPVEQPKVSGFGRGGRKGGPK